MSESGMVAPAPGSVTASVSTEGASEVWAASGDKATPGKGVVFVDFGCNKIYALTADGDEVLVFNNLVEMAGRLKPEIVVVDSLPGKQQSTAAELARIGIMFLRLKELGKLAEERRNNGVRKSDEDDVRLLRTLYHRHPNLFQPISTYPEELEVRALTEMWVELAGQKKSAKRARTVTNNPVAVEAHKTLQRFVKKLAEEIHEEAMKLPLYRRAFEELGLKGPTLAYIVSHDSWALTTIPRDSLILRYQMTGRRKHRKRKMRSRLLIMLANTTVIHKHGRYHEVYQRYFDRFKTDGRKKAYWKAVLRVAERILKDLHSIAKRTLDT